LGFVATNFATAPHKYDILKAAEFGRMGLNQDTDLSIAMNVLPVVLEHALFAPVDRAERICGGTKVFDILPKREIRFEDCVIAMLVVEIKGKNIRPRTWN
jgi:hypothetical protein